MTSNHKKAKIHERRIRAINKRRHISRYKHTCPKCNAKKKRLKNRRQEYLKNKANYGKKRAKEMMT